MKSAVFALFAALALSASVAHAEPPKADKPAATAKKKSKAQKPKGTFSCTLAELTLLETPDLERELELFVVVRVKCINKTNKTVRIDRNDVTLITSDGRGYKPSRRSGNFDIYFSDENPGPVFVRGFVNIEAGEDADLGFIFTGGAPISDPDMVLDIDGIDQFEHHRAMVAE